MESGQTLENYAKSLTGQPRRLAVANGNELAAQLKTSKESRGRRMKEKTKATRPEPDFSSNKTCLIHELIKSQTRQTPDAIAVEFESFSLSYSELDRGASRLAKLL